MEQDLLTRAHKDINFKAEVAKNQQKYKALEQASDYASTQHIPNTILKRIQTKDHCEIYLYFGYMQPILKKYMQQLAMYLVKNFKPNTDKSYKFVFFNDKSPDNYILWNFRETFSYLKLQQIAALSEFIIVKPYFYHKTMDWMTFGVIPKFIRGRTKFIYSYKQLCDHLKITQHVLAQNIPNWYFKEELADLYASHQPLQQFRMNIEGQQRNQQQKNEVLQFQKSIVSMIMKPGYEINNIQDYEIGVQGVPNILKMLVFYFDSHKQGLQLEGIFRKSVSIDEQNETIRQIVSKNYDYLLIVENPHIIANLIKRFFSSLKTPIFPYSKFYQLMNDQNETDKLKHLKKVFDSLPELNRTTLTFIFTFFKQKVLKNQIHNKMNVQNISICFAPCIFRSQKPTAADLVYAGKGVAYCKLALTEFDTIFGSPQQRQNLYRNSYLQKKKDFQQQLQVKDMTQDNEGQLPLQSKQSDPNNLIVVKEVKVEPQKKGNEQQSELQDHQFNKLLNIQTPITNARHSMSKYSQKEIKQEEYFEVLNSMAQSEPNNKNAQKAQNSQNKQNTQNAQNKQN